MKVINSIAVIDDAIVLETGRRGGDPYVLWAVPMNAGWQGESAMIVQFSLAEGSTLYDWDQENPHGCKGMVLTESAIRKLLAGLE